MRTSPPGIPGDGRPSGLYSPVVARPRGAALLLVTGFLSLLALLAVSFLFARNLLATHARAAAAAERADLAVRSGLDYAAARLWADARSVTGTGNVPSAANRCDDRIPRGGEPVTLAPRRRQNPSYARGDGWTDADGDGAWTPGVDAPLPAADLDADGRLDAWSGRLRGGSADACRFSLDIRCAGGLVSVNSGEIGSVSDDHDLDGIPNGDPASGYAAAVPAGAWCDPAWPGNVHLVNLLDNLGAVLDLSIRQTGVPFHPGAGALGPIETSPLGSLVVSNRPQGGYTSLEPLHAALSAADFEKVAPFLTVRRETIAVSRMASGSKKDLAWLRIFDTIWQSAYEFHVPIRFNEAPVEVLAASLRHITASGSYYQLIVGGPLEPQTPFVRLYPEAEADDVAAALAARRPIHDWRDFLQELHASAAPFFRDDPFTAVNESVDPGRRLLKEDLILAQVGPDGYFGDTHAWRMNTLEVARDTGIGIDATSTRRILKESLFGLLNTAPFDQSGNSQTSLNAAAMFSNIAPRVTTEYDLADDAPGAFVVRASGWMEREGQETASADLRGEIVILDSVRLDGQQEFEMFSTAARPVTATNPWRLAGGAVLAEGACQKKLFIDSDPKFPLDSYCEASLPTTGQGWAVGNYAYCPVEGGLRLQARPEEGIDAPCVFALPFNPDPLPPPPNRWYGSASGTQDDWLDNVGDPAGSAGAHRSPDPAYGGATNPLPPLHRGFHAGSQGIRFNPIPAGNLFNLSWDAATPFPLPLGAQGRIADATISLWYPSHGGESLILDVTPPHFNAPYLELQYRDLSTSNTWRTYLRWQFPGVPSETFRVDVLSQTRTITPWWTADPVVAACGWHHLAFAFSPAGDFLTVHVDGRPDAQGPIAIGFPTGSVGQDQWRLSLRFPMDDLRFFAADLGSPTIEAQALDTDRFADRRGTYLSSRFRPDPARFPDGVTLRGISWDAFIPEQTAGRFTFDAVGYKGGVPLNPNALSDPGRAIPWNGTTPPGAVFSVPGCDAFEIGVTINAASPTLTIPGPNGLHAPLRDTPYLDSVTLRLAGRRPRWTGVSSR